MMINPAKSKGMIVSRSRTINPEFSEIYVGGSTIKDVCFLSILGVLFDPKMSFEPHLRRVAASASQRLGIMRRDDNCLEIWFFSADVSNFYTSSIRVLFTGVAVFCG